VPQEQGASLLSKQTRRDQEDVFNPPSTPLNLLDQVGYSSMDDSNAFMGLQKVISPP
jgi:hypothetical protein